MAHVVTLYDFNDVNPRTKKVEHQLEVNGWYPVDVEYSFNDNGRYVTLCWKVVGSDHVFSIEPDVIDVAHHGNIREHFQQTLMKFREHYIRWEELGYPPQWREKYREKIGRFIKD